MKIEAFNKEDLNLIELAQNYSDEDKARELLESLLWPNGAICPHCKCDDVYKLTPKPKPARCRHRSSRARFVRACIAAGPAASSSP